MMIFSSMRNILLGHLLATLLETYKPFHRKMPLDRKWHSSLQCTSLENTTSLEFTEIVSNPFAQSCVL